jgi:hypothetical protein
MIMKLENQRAEPKGAVESVKKSMIIVSCLVPSIVPLVWLLEGHGTMRPLMYIEILPAVFLFKKSVQFNTYGGVCPPLGRQVYLA